MPQLLPKRLSSDHWILLSILLCCVGLRFGMIVLRFDELNSDPDSYLGIARNLNEGSGYSTPGTDSPTAFRPPLYPILISAISSDTLAWARGLLNLLAAAGSLVLIWKSAQHLGLSRSGRILATLVYGLDPLLLRYTSLSMTETLASFMTAVLLWRLTVPAEATDVSQTQPSNWGSAVVTGIIFGLCVLTRPTYWVFAFLYGTFISWQFLRFRSTERSQIIPRSLAVAMGAALVVGPWLVRNLIVLESPVLMTTHGGYTILLGNNKAFYEEVVNQPFGTVWDGSKGPGQAVWANGINQEMDALGLITEVERDLWMSSLAKQAIRNNPKLFLKACWLRFARFWNVVPSGPAADPIPGSVLYAVGTYYTCVWLLLIVGLFNLCREEATSRQRWVPVVLLAIAFTALHLVYWSNVRMRAPIVPALSLIAGAVTTGTTSMTARRLKRLSRRSPIS
jgi:hypothetical protein